MSVDNPDELGLVEMAGSKDDSLDRRNPAAAHLHLRTAGTCLQHKHLDPLMPAEDLYSAIKHVGLADSVEPLRLAEPRAVSGVPLLLLKC
ncbi:MAG: hypothetical protein HY901_30915 [Deltaproteobacteria bacterium]|nr:hypothetical protein [Deltaproteobacteria bacterium]